MTEADTTLPSPLRAGVGGGGLSGEAAAPQAAPHAGVVLTQLPTPVPLPSWGRGLLHETWKYFLVSLAALALDYALLVALTSLGHVHYLISAAVGFAAGLVLNYALSVAFVFRQRRLADRRMEFAGFFLIGLAGLALNEALMKLFVDGAGLGYALAKVPATGVGFVFNFGVRRAMLFTAPTSQPRP
jgi:putative flippase GtrA